MLSPRRILAVLVAGALAFLAETGTAKDQEFRLEKPDAQSVAVAGEFNSWHAQAMSKQGDGIWSVMIPLSAGTYGYKFLVNGSDWLFDPNNANRKKVDNVENSLIEISAADGSSGSPVTPVTPSVSRMPAATPSPSSSLSHPASSGTPASVSANVPPAGGLSSNPGEVSQVEVKLSAAERSNAAKEGNARLTTARMAIAVPAGFDAQKSWPVLVINNTENYSNIDSMNQFKQAANDEGWVIVAADPVESEKDEHGAWRWPCLAAGLDYLIATWPGAKNWPVACGGMSGGAKNSAFVAADVAKAHYHLVGMLMMGCNQDMASVAFHKSAPPQFLGVPIFLSSGKADTIATPAQHEDVKNSMKGTGFQKVRLETHSGAHDVYQPHIGEALKWFVAESGKGAKLSTPSSFDRFFKKP